ncbi:hypothetical protein [Amycolatopsis sp. CA-126428]|uniref:hypothetical protein n=1 Tax=Amycolatopsis sp. CA-126428 TaxID=2073158 RepID=UPI000CD2992F|nr:hypothetical protein [Amycolatopsis sp. CA-126428]
MTDPDVERKDADSAITPKTPGLTGRARAGITADPGPFAFRELPPIAISLDQRFGVPGDESHYLAHSQRLASASAGPLTGGSPFGVVESRAAGGYGTHNVRRLRVAPVDAAGRTQGGIEAEDLPTWHPIAVQAGYLPPRYRLPETTRHADRLFRAGLR